MEKNRIKRGLALATGLAVTFSSSMFLAGCGSGSSGSAPATISPETEQKTQDMLKNKSQQYNDRFQKKGGRAG